MAPTRDRLRRARRAAGPKLSCLLLALGTIATSTPVLAEEKPGQEPGGARAASVRSAAAAADTRIREALEPWDTTPREPSAAKETTPREASDSRDTTRRDATLRERIGPVRMERFRTAPGLRPDVAPEHDPGPRAAAFESLTPMMAAPASMLPSGEGSRSTWAVAGAAVAGSALGWAVGATAGLLATHDRFAQDDLSPLLYAVIGGAAVSVPAGAVSAHWASGGRGSILTSTLLGYAVAGATMLVWPDGGWALGPALAIPIAVMVEAP